MNELKAPSLQSLLESDKGSTDSLLAESILDLDDVEYSIPPAELPTLAAVLSEFEADSDIASELGVPVIPAAPTPTPSIADEGGSAVRGGGAGGGGSIMRYTMLQGVSAQVSSAADRVNSGLATACAVSALIAVGTSHGHILNFDITQTLRWAHQDKHAQGAVATLAYNPDSTRLLAGYARGLIAMFDTQSGDVLRHVFDGITPNTGVLHVKWTSRPALALAADSGGSVWSLSFTRKLGIRGCSSRCLFSGARGEVCTVEPLIMDVSSGGGGGGSGTHELDQYCIVALATLSKYFIVMIRPRLKVIKYHALQGPADCLPLLAWQMVLIQAADTTRSVDPVLVVGRGTQLYFHQLFMANGRIALLFLRHVQMQANLLSAHWLGPKCVGCLDTSEILHLIDVRSSKELECIDMANAGLVYGSAQFKALATGGNVSPALALAGTHACYSSVSSRGSQLYVLGGRSLHMIAVRTWTERISYLVKNQRWQEACDIALEGYRAAAERPKRRAQARERILMLFQEYLTASARAPDYCLGAMVKCLIEVDELELLWTQLWERLHNTAPFLQHISEHIEQERIRRLNPLISQALVDYWLRISPAKLEELILKLDWTCLDLNQVLKAIKQHRLYRAQIYLNTHALNDYAVSLTELIPLLSSPASATEERHSELGNCLLVYISSCLAGRSYPNGDIPADHVQGVKHDVLRCLTSAHSLLHADSDGGELPYPYMRALLQFDTRETLNVISLAFQEREFNGELGLSHRKRIIDILLEIMTPENATWAEIGCLLNFIAQQMSQHCLPRDPQLLHQLLEYVAMPHIAHETARQHSEREGAWLELLASDCLQAISDDEAQLALARRARCHYVEECLLERLRRYDTMFECYLADSHRHDALYAYIERYAMQPERCVYAQLRRHIKRLLQINVKELLRLVDGLYQAHIDELLGDIGDDERLLYLFLQHLHKRRQHAAGGGGGGGGGGVVGVGGGGGLALSQAQSERLLELLCTYAPHDVLPYLSNSAVAPCRSERALAVVQRAQLVHAEIWLHERRGDYAAAFKLSLQLLAAATQADAAMSQAQQVSALCARASSVPQLAGGEAQQRFWFELLQLAMPRADLKGLVKTLLHQASQYVDLAALVQLVMHTSNVTSNFGDIRDLLLSMLRSSRYEMRAIETATRIIAIDMHAQLARQRQQACRGLYVSLMRCGVCNNRLYNQSNVLVMGACGHAVHELCAQRYEAAERAATAPATWSSLALASDGGCGGGDSDGDGDDITELQDDVPRRTRCPRCQVESRECVASTPPIQLSNPSQCVYAAAPSASSSHTLAGSGSSKHDMIVLALKAPPPSAIRRH